MHTRSLSLAFTLTWTFTTGATALLSQDALHPTVPRLVAEASIRSMDALNTNVYLPVTIQGHAATLLLGFGIDGGLSLTPGRLAQLGVTLPDSTRLDALTLGTTVLRHVAMRPWGRLRDGPPDLPPVVGVVGNQFLTQYDIVYDGPAHRVRLYDLPAHTSTRPEGTHTAWLPPELPSASCTSILPLPEHNAGFAIQANGHAIPAILETMSSYTKMNMFAAKAMGLTQHSSEVHPVPADFWERQDGYGHPVKWQATGIQLTLGTQHFTVVPITIFPGLDVDRYSTPVPPILLLNPDDLRGQMLVMSNSAGQVCLGVPRGA
jgi:hypothetical protein